MQLTITNKYIIYLVILFIISKRQYIFSYIYHNQIKQQLTAEQYILLSKLRLKDVKYIIKHHNGVYECILNNYKTKYVLSPALDKTFQNLKINKIISIKYLIKH